MEHNVKKGDVIASRKTSPIWIDMGEVFVVKGVIESEGGNGEGVLFTDRTGSDRVFWSTTEYEVINKK